MAAKMTDIKTIMQAGIDPKTGLPRRFSQDVRPETYEGIKKLVRIIDEQNAVNRYQWSNLPCNLTSQELERLIYYKGQLVFFYLEELDEFYFMPYALDGTIDFYGRFNTVHPVPLSSGMKDEDTKAQADILSKIKLKCVYGEMFEEDVTDEVLTKSGVLLHDYTKQLSQIIIPRQELNDPLCKLIAEMPSFIQTSLINSTGVKGVRVNDADQKDEVKEASASMYKAALQGENMIPIISTLELQELAGGSVGKSQDFLLTMQSLDNYRLGTYGIVNGGLFEKNVYVNKDEFINGSAEDKLVYQDGLAIRQNFCNIVNSIWDLGIWCEASECVMGQDIDGDGINLDQNGEGENGGIEDVE